MSRYWDDFLVHSDDDYLEHKKSAITGKSYNDYDSKGNSKSYAHDYYMNVTKKKNKTGNSSSDDFHGGDDYGNEPKTGEDYDEWMKPKPKEDGPYGGKIEDIMVSNRPQGRKHGTVTSSGSVHKRGDGLGTGKVGNADYTKRKKKGSSIHISSKSDHLVHSDEVSSRYWDNFLAKRE